MLKSGKPLQIPVLHDMDEPVPSLLARWPLSKGMTVTLICRFVVSMADHTLEPTLEITELMTVA